MSNLLESLIGEMPGMKDLPPDEKKKMKKAIRATSEKVQSLDLEGIFKTALSNDTGKSGKKTAAINALLGDMPPPPPKADKPDKPDKLDKVSKSKRKKGRNSHKKKPKTPDKQYQLNLSLNELYSGKTSKRLTVRVDRRVDLTEEDRKAYTEENGGEEPPEGAYKYENVKIKLPISDFLEAGMIDDDLIHFVGESDQAEKHDTGDIIACIVQDQHDVFEREGNDLWILNNKVSLYESYVGGFKFPHLDGRVLEIVPKDGEPLHADGGLRCIKNAGMPIKKEDVDEDGMIEDDDVRNGNSAENQEYGDLYIQFDLELPKKYEGEQLEMLSTICAKDEKGLSELEDKVKKLTDSGVEPYKITVDKAEDPYDESIEIDDDSNDSDEDSDEESVSEDEVDDSNDDSDETAEEEEGEETEDESEDEQESAAISDKAAIELLMEDAQEKGEAALDPEEAINSLKDTNVTKKKKSIKG